MPFKHNTPTPAELVAFLAPPSPALSRNNIESASLLAKGAIWSGERPGEMALVVVLISVPSVSLLASTVHLFTAKRLHPAAQGRRASRRTLGYRFPSIRYAEGVSQGYPLTRTQGKRIVVVVSCQTPAGYRGRLSPVSQGGAAAPLTLGCGIDNNEADSFVRLLTKTAYNQECQRC